MNFKKMKREIRNFFIRWSMETEDDFWYNHGQPGGMYPPSFYATHTQEEIEEICRQDMEKLQEMAKKYDIEITYDDQFRIIKCESTEESGLNR